jgi:hypothetical protein
MCKSISISLFAGVLLCVAGWTLIAAGTLSTPKTPQPADTLPDIPPGDLADLIKRPLDDDGFQDQGNEGGNRPFFDDFSWRAFIALNWPAVANTRGKADLTKKFGDTTDRVVWESWKVGPEIVPPDGTDPTEWDAPPGKRTALSQVNKFADFRQAGFGVSEAPLIDQRKKYVRFELAVNEVEFNEIFSKQYFKKEKLIAAAAAAPGGKVEFPTGSIEVKAAWRELPDDPKILDRFYWREADVVDWTDDGREKLTRTKVGLVGLHIVTKTKQRPNWIWSTFEHEDNVVSSPGGVSPPSFSAFPAGSKWTFPGPSTPKDWEKKIKPKSPLPDFDPVEVSRKLDLSQFPETDMINQRYRTHPQVRDTIWARYKLVRTQWPIQAPGTPLDGKPSPKSDVANVTMETYRQTVTCMACHEQAAKSRFVYFLELRVDPVESVKALDATLKDLRQ